MSSGKKTCLVIGIIFAVLIIGGIVVYYYFFVGFTKAQKYDRCVKLCKEIMLRDEDIPACKMKCAQLHGSHPEVEEKAVKKPAPKTTVPATGETKSPISALKTGGKEYDCNFVWPQEIIERVSRKLVYTCPLERPWCNFEDYSFEKVGCCTNYDELRKVKTDCINLPQLLNK